MRKKQERRSDCPINFGLENFGDKWSLLIIRDLALRGKVGYGDFLDSEEEIATNILADRLQSLESAGIIKKKEDPKNKSKYIYSLTEKGLDLIPMMLEMILWSAKYDPKTVAPKALVDMIKSDKEKMVRKIREGISQNKFIEKEIW